TFGHPVLGVQCRIDFGNLPGADLGAFRQFSVQLPGFINRQTVRHGRSGPAGDAGVEAVDVEGNVNKVTMVEHFQRFAGHHGRSELFDFLGFDKVDVVFVQQVVLRLFQVSHGNVDDVFRVYLRAGDADVLDLFPVFQGLATRIVYLALKVVD